MENVEPTSQLQQRMQDIERLTEDLPTLVRAARRGGATWEQIGNALGMTKQGAHKLYAHKLGYEFPLGPEY